MYLFYRIVLADVLGLIKMTSAESICYTLIYSPSVTDSEPVNETKLKNDIEHGDVRTKTDALKRVILMTLNGEKLQGMLLVHNCTYEFFKKKFLLFWLNKQYETAIVNYVSFETMILMQHFSIGLADCTASLQGKKHFCTVSSN